MALESNSLALGLLVTTALALANGCSSGGGAAAQQGPGTQGDCGVDTDASAAPLAAWYGTIQLRSDATAQANGATAFDVDPATLLVTERFPDISWSGSLRVSPDGQLTALRTTNGLTVIRTANDLELLRTLGAGAYQWSRDSRYVHFDVFADGLYEIDTQTTDVRQLVTSPSGTFAGALSVAPDRSSMIWAHVDGMVLELRTAPFDPNPAAAPIPATAGALILQSVASSGAVLGCVYVDDTTVLLNLDDGDGGGLYEVDVTSGSASRKLLIPDLADFQLSPDASQVAYSTFDGTFVADVTSWTPRAIDCSGEQNLGVAWAPNSQYVALLRRGLTSPAIELIIAAVDGSGSWRLLSFTPSGSSTLNPPAALVQQVTQAISWGG